MGTSHLVRGARHDDGRRGHRAPLGSPEGDQLITVLSGGVGAARLLAGILQVHPPADVTAIVNVGDDVELHGLHISPDLDTITYTLAGAIDPARGWGLAGETWHAMEALRRYPGARAWFNLGDQDLATHLYRTDRLRAGASLSTVTAEIAAAWGLALRVIPVSDDPVRTRLTTAEGEIGFQEYFVQRQHDVTVTAVRFDGAAGAGAAPGVIDAIAEADRVVIAPSNPIVSIAPVLAVAGVERTVTARRDAVVAVSPIVAGAALKGPADRLLRELGHEASVIGVARLYAPLAATLVIDEADADLAVAVEAEGLRCLVTSTIMRGPAEAAALAKVVLAA
ncbi:MAG: 2-phospho-L-lactate transferase [Microthrixaceae bacterium]